MNDCRAGCSIGSIVCQAGYFCAPSSNHSRIMTECPVGTYRTAPTNISLITPEYADECLECPYGTYRERKRGKSLSDCTLCPAGKYSNATGKRWQFKINHT